MIRKYAEIFCWKNVSSFCSAKATHIFSAKNIRILYIESAKTVNEMTLNELVKLTTLWTTGPWFIKKLLTICSGIQLHEMSKNTSYNLKTLSNFGMASTSVDAVNLQLKGQICAGLLGTFWKTGACNGKKEKRPNLGSSISAFVVPSEPCLVYPDTTHDPW